MDRRRRETKPCRKIPYATSDDATRAMIEVITNRGDDNAENAEAYQCSQCGHWHWGHRKSYAALVKSIERQRWKVQWPPRVKSA